METDKLSELGLLFGVGVLRMGVLLFARKTYFLPVFTILIDLFLQLVKVSVKPEILQPVNLFFFPHLFFLLFQYFQLFSNRLFILQKLSFL
jgi:hypothetical protein